MNRSIVPPMSPLLGDRPVAPLTPPRYTGTTAPPPLPASTSGPRVTIVTEGSYPFTYGGVSTWCDQLIRNLGDTTFEVVAITGRRGNRARWTLPPNLARVTELGFWEPKAPGENARYARAMGRRAQHYPSFRCVYQLLETLVAEEPDADAFDALLDRLIAESRAHRLAPALRAPWTVETLTALWHQRGETPSMSDVVLALDVLEHLLRTVAYPLPPADIYHAVSNGLAALAAVAAAAETGAPVVLSEHGVYLRERYIEYLGGGAGSAARDLILRFHRLLTITMYRRADLILPVSSYNRRWELHNGADPSRIRVIHNGVDPARFPDAPERPVEGPPVIGFLSRIDRIKDPLTLIRATATIRVAIPEVQVRLWGETAVGQDDYLLECQAEITRLGLDDVIHLEGRTEDPVAAYRSVDVVAMSSISEGLPYGVLEAMMSGVAIVSTDVGGIREALDGVGVLVEAGDHRALGEACVELLRDPRRRRDLGRRARQRALGCFTLDQMLDRYRAAYRDVEPTIDLRDHGAVSNRVTTAARTG